MRQLNCTKVIFLFFFLLFSNFTFAADAPLEPQDEIMKNFTEDDLTRGLSVTVEVKNGIASLSGEVENIKQAYRLVTLAESVKGITDVDVTNLNISNGEKFSYYKLLDAIIIGTLIREKAFGENVDLKNFPIQVETVNGLTYLAGNVDYRYQLNNAINMTRRVKGVQRVISKLNVRYY